MTTSFGARVRARVRAAWLRDSMLPSRTDGRSGRALAFSAGAAGPAAADARFGWLQPRLFDTSTKEDQLRDMSMLCSSNSMVVYAYPPGSECDL